MAIVNTNKLEVTKLDFHGIRDSLKTFLQGQTEFNDYDFDGSGLGTILDLLSYNTHYMAFYLNMVANEMFMDTASQRSSVVGIARGLGYTPKSARGSLASVNFTLTTGSGASTITLPRWTQFSVVVDKDKFLFYTLDSKVVTTSGNNAAFVKIPIKEGIYVKNSWTHNSQGKKQRFILDNQYIDTTTLLVTVKASKTTGTASTYALYKDLQGLDSTSEVYFLQEVEDGKYEIYFGDGIYGKALSDENVITAEYLTTNGSMANHAGKNANEGFSLVSTVNDSNGQSTTATSITLSPNGHASGGTLPESISSIKFNAPLSYAAQDRTVTANDYKNVLLSNYGNIRGVKVWGGRPHAGLKLGGLQERSGTVYICILPKHGNYLPLVTKNYIIQSILAPYKMLGIRNEIIDPKFISLLISIEVVYNPTSTELSPDVLNKKIRRSVKKYNMTDLEVFDGKYRHSVLQSVISDADPSIVSVSKMVVKFRHQSRFDFSNLQSMMPIRREQDTDYNWKKIVFNPIDFGMSIEPSTLGGGVQSNTFYVWANSLTQFYISGGFSNEEKGFVASRGAYSEFDRWMASYKIFLWSMKKADSGGDPNVSNEIKGDVQAGRFIECYYKDDGQGRLNLYAVGEDGGSRIPYRHPEGFYSNSVEFSWIESQANRADWKTIYDNLRTVNHLDENNTTAVANHKLLDYESWGTVNYQKGTISKMKPITILGIASDIKFFGEGETPLSIAANHMFSAAEETQSIMLNTKIQHLNFEGYQYLDKNDTRLGGYTAAGRNILKIDMDYLNQNLSLRKTTDRPSLQIGSRAATEEVQKSLSQVIKGGETQSKKLHTQTEVAILDAGATDSFGMHGSTTYDAETPTGMYGSSNYSADLSVITEETLAAVEDPESIIVDSGGIEDDTVDKVLSRVVAPPSVYGSSVIETKTGAVYQISCTDKDILNELIMMISSDSYLAAYSYAQGALIHETWDIWQTSPPTNNVKTPTGTTSSVVVSAVTPDLKVIATVSDDPVTNDMANNPSYFGGSTSSVSTQDSSFYTGYTASQNTTAVSGDDDYIPDDSNIKPITPTGPDPTSTVISYSPFTRPSEAELENWRQEGYYWNPETGEYELEESAQLSTGGAVIDTSTVNGTVTGEVDYATASATNEQGFSSYSEAGDAYSAAAASTMDTSLDLKELENVAREFTNTTQGTVFNEQDLNKDGVVDLFDLVLAAKRSTPKPPADDYYGSSNYSAEG